MAANSFLGEKKELEELEEQEDLAPISARNPLVTDLNDSEQNPSDYETEEMSSYKTDDEKMTAVRRCKLWLGQQKIDYNTELIKRRLQHTEDLQTFPSDGGDVSDVCERITKLQDELFEIASKKSYGKLVLERLLQGDMLLKILFPDILTESPSQEDIAKMNEFATICVKNDDICSKILQNHQDLTETQRKLDKVKQKNYEIKKTNRELMTKLQNLRAKRDEIPSSAAENEAIVRAKEEYHRLLAKQHDIANIFQALIVGSGINWAADDQTRQLVLSIGEIMNEK